MNFNQKHYCNYCPTIYDRCCRNAIFDSTESQYSLTLSVPQGKKVKINNRWVIFHQLSFSKQCEFYNKFLEDHKLVYNIAYELHHPDNPDDPRRYHAHIILYFGCDDFLNYLREEYTKYCSFDTPAQTGGIFYYKRLEKETDFVSWINYMYKEHVHHWQQVTEEEQMEQEKVDNVIAQYHVSNKYKIDITELDQ